MISLINKKVQERREVAKQEREIREFMAAFDQMIAKQPSDAESKAEMDRIGASAGVAIPPPLPFAALK